MDSFLLAIAAILGNWISQNEALFTALTNIATALISYHLGTRNTLRLTRRTEWNAVVDRVRATLLNSTAHAPQTLGIAVQDQDLLITLAGFLLRRRIGNALRRHGQIVSQSTGSNLGHKTYDESQKQEMQAIKDELLVLITRR